MKPKLKSLELHGYKTFAGKVKFEFPGNITAIVGPNGSGKSNISDAIRWVLGEQSYSLLRGKKTEDMIFLGSDQRPKAGMASATILFDNEDGWLPVDYSEVGIARRAYRDGSNEYLLNRQRVRLKDISELLAQSGLAERTYTIIGQGLVDAALSLRPEERRRFFEEAAGIGLFRSRREESLSRLDSTQRNLERVTDILSELEPRMKSLERQAKRVDEYDRVKADLQVLLRDWYGYHWQNTQKEFLHNREILKNQQEKVENARGKREEIEKQVDGARIRLQELRTKLNAWHMESSAFHRDRERVSREIAVLEERLRAFHNQEINLKNDLNRDEELSVSYADKLKNLQMERSKIEEELAECKDQLESTQAAFTARQQERGVLEGRLNQDRKKLVELETRQVQLKAHQRELEARILTYQTSRTNLLAQIEKSRTAVTETQTRQSEILAEKSRLDQKIKESETDLAEITSQIQAVDATTRDHSAKLNKLETDLAKAKAQLDVLVQAELAFSGLGEGSKSLLSAAGAGKLPGRYQAVSSMLEVSAELETAISAALGEQLDAVLFSDTSDAEIILQFLETSAAGRTMLIPLSMTRPADKVRDIRGENVIGVAADLVSIKESTSGLVNFLLGQVVVVRDRRTAGSIISQLPQWARVVTLKGEVFNANGVIIAGKENRSGLINRPRQKKELTELVSSLSSLQEASALELNDLNGQTETLIAKRKTIENEIREHLNQQRDMNMKVSEVERDLTQLRQKLEWQNSQVETLLKQMNDSKAEMKHNADELETGLSGIGELNTTLQKINEDLRAIPIDEIQSQVVHWNTTQAITERALKEAQTRLSEFDLSVARNQETIKQTTDRIQQLAESITAAEQENTRLREEETQINLKITASRQQIEPAEKELNDTESEYSRLQHEYSQTQQFEANTDRVFTQAQLEFSRSREAIDNLRRRIEDDFGLVALEYSEDIEGPTPLPMEGIGELKTITELPRGLDESINRQRAILRRMGAINPDAQSEYREVKDRHEFLTSQLTDLRKADEDLRQIIAELDDLMHRQFRATFNAVAAEFKEMFARLFGGGSARLVMTDEDNPTETGIDIEARLPGRREQGLSLLSGGERSLTAVALVFSLLRVSPTPFCILDEVDAMLDEANVGRFTELLRELSQETQFIVITHNRNTVQVADVIYGVTMGRDSASQVISLRLDEVNEEMVR